MARWAQAAILVSLLVGGPSAAMAQNNALSDQERLGERLFNQSCVVCHKNPQLGSVAYAPALSMNTLGGKADVIDETISNGTPRMPGFKIQFTSTQIDAIAAYIKTLPVPTDAPPPARKAGGGGLD